MNQTISDKSNLKIMLNKVPEVTIYFWIIKILATTVGETAADFLATNLNLGLTKTTLVMSTLLAATLFFQFRLNKYVPGIYWISVVMISIVGTLITDNLVDNFGVALTTTTIIFGAAMIGAFALWYLSEKTLSIHTITTTKREVFYWTAILFTFALGTAAGDLIAEHFALGYWKSSALFAAIIAVVAILHKTVKLNSILAFWLAYIVTRPLGASIGDYMSQAKKDGGLGLGATTTSIIFLVAILVVVLYLSITKVDIVNQSSDNMALIEHKTYIDR